MAAVGRKVCGWVRLTFTSCQQKTCKRHLSEGVKVKTLGTFEPTQSVETPYRDGQLFFHKHFYYRGIIVSSWQAYGNVTSGRKTDNSRTLQDVKDDGNETKKSDTSDMDPPRRYLFYHALMDMEDTQPKKYPTGAATYLLKKKKSIMSVDGTDLVFHEDIMPYSTSDANPIKNDLMADLFTRQRSNLTNATQFEICKAFNDQEVKNNHHCWLQSSRVYSAVTKTIQVTVIPFYIGNEETDHTVAHYWRYCIRIQNHGKEKLQLRKRNWHIYCGKTLHVETIRASGVVGQEPILSPDEPVFQYCSHTSLQSPMGQMWGHFVMETENGTYVECAIPQFPLKIREEDSNF